MLLGLERSTPTFRPSSDVDGLEGGATNKDEQLDGMASDSSTFSPSHSRLNGLRILVQRCCDHDYNLCPEVSEVLQVLFTLSVSNFFLSLFLLLVCFGVLVVLRVTGRFLLLCR